MRFFPPADTINVSAGVFVRRQEHAMKTSEGRFGRVFVVSLEKGDAFPACLENFAAEKGVKVAVAHAFAAGGDAAASGLIVPDAGGRPTLMFFDAVARDSAAGRDIWRDGEVVVQELLGAEVRLVRDPAGAEVVAAAPAKPVTRVMKKPAPAPEEGGPASIPVYLFNAEFN